VKIAVLGYGVEGKSVVLYFLQHFKDAEIEVLDQRSVEGVPEGVAGRVVGEFTEVDLSDFDMIFRSPTVLPEQIRTTRDNVTSVTEYFFEQCPAPIVGVTATKGKGTMSTLITALLRAGGKKAWLVGNIGIAALDVLDEVRAEDWVVYEIGVSQARDMRVSPRVAVIGTIAPDHLDLLGTFENYVDAKANVARYQKTGDLIVYYERNQYSREIAAQSPAARKLTYPSEVGAHVRDGAFWYGEQEICLVEVLKLPGAHNQENALAAITAVWGVVDAAAIARGLAEVEDLPHRIELVRELDGVAYYDDSFSSATPAAEVAVAAFERPVILIAGGFDRGLDYAEFTQHLRGLANLKRVLVIGQVKERLAAGLGELAEQFDTLEAAAVRARELAVAGDVVLMSPGAPSFDMFKDFYERGEKFQELVKSWQ
jgi:UDP-N-acetylmuramoylalanine--D-glutamate ligase